MTLYNVHREKEHFEYNHPWVVCISLTPSNRHEIGQRERRGWYRRSDRTEQELPRRWGWGSCPQTTSAAVRSPWRGDKSEWAKIVYLLQTRAKRSRTCITKANNQNYEMEPLIPQPFNHFLPPQIHSMPSSHGKMLQMIRKIQWQLNANTG